MSALVFQGARHANASTAGNTASDTAQKGIAYGRNLADQAAQAIAGITPLQEFLGGGIHPENAVGTAVSTDVVRATDSVQGAFGGLKPRLGSTVGPGPAGQAAKARSTFGTSLRSLFSAAPAPATTIAPEPPPLTSGPPPITPTTNSSWWDGQLNHPGA